MLTGWKATFSIFWKSLARILWPILRSRWARLSSEIHVPFFLERKQSQVTVNQRSNSANNIPCSSLFSLRQVVLQSWFSDSNSVLSWMRTRAIQIKLIHIFIFMKISRSTYLSLFFENRFLFVYFRKILLKLPTFFLSILKNFTNIKNFSIPIAFIFEF